MTASRAQPVAVLYDDNTVENFDPSQQVIRERKQRNSFMNFATINQSAIPQTLAELPPQQYKLLTQLIQLLDQNNIISGTLTHIQQKLNYSSQPSFSRHLMTLRKLHYVEVGKSDNGASFIAVDPQIAWKGTAADHAHAITKWQLMHNTHRQGIKAQRVNPNTKKVLQLASARNHNNKPQHP